MSTPRFDALAFIMAMEGDTDDLEHDYVVSGYQNLIDSGIIFSLQGSWQRAAQRMIDAGYCIPPTNRRQA
jgi:hypothetical protein